MSEKTREYLWVFAKGQKKTPRTELRDVAPDDQNEDASFNPALAVSQVKTPQDAYMILPAVWRDAVDDAAGDSGAFEENAIGNALGESDLDENDRQKIEELMRMAFKHTLRDGRKNPVEKKFDEYFYNEAQN